MRKLLKCSRCGRIYPAESMGGLCMDCVVEITLGRGPRKTTEAGQEQKEETDPSSPPLPPESDT